ncbi:MAG: tetratricopeptide repeat protein [Planctomycetales bacterium]|nr:tetratricopeptide repeat protein [Planctomycetales bacterium]
MSDAHTLFSEGRQLMNAGQHEDALQKLGAALEADPNHALTHLTLCRLLSQLNQHDKAIEHGERACQLEPGEQINFTVLSVTYQKALAATGDMRYMELAERARDRGMGT